MHRHPLIVISAALTLSLLFTPTAHAAERAPGMQAHSSTELRVPAPLAEDLARGEQTSGRAVVVIEGGGSTHAFTTPWDACDGGRPTYIQALLDAGLAVFTAPGFGNSALSTAGRSGCPPQPPLNVQWNTTGYPTQAGQAVLGFLGYLNATYGYHTFDLVGYSYGGIISRATVAALKQPPAPSTMASAFSYEQVAVDAGISIPTIVTLNTPHLGAPSYDIAFDPTRYTKKVSQSWGAQYAETGKGLRIFETMAGAGAIQVLKTSGHARNDPNSWDARQVGMLDGVALTLIAGDYCGRTCGKGRLAKGPGGRNWPRTDATVPLYSQLIRPCPGSCPAPPGSVYIPAGMIPEDTVRKVFPTVHSTFDTDRLGLPPTISVSKNPEAISYLVETVVKPWRAAGVPLLSR